MTLADRPASGRFQKGHTGNPKGRPRKAPPSQGSVFDVILDRTLTVTHQGEPREITMEEALQQRTYQDALSGKAMERRTVLKWIAKRDAWFEKHSPKPKLPPYELKQRHDPDNANAVLLMLGITVRDDRWSDDPYQPRLLARWAAQAALDRRRSAVPLTENEVKEIRRSTQEGDALRWPRGTPR